MRIIKGVIGNKKAYSKVRNILEKEDEKMNNNRISKKKKYIKSNMKHNNWIKL